MLDKLIKYIPLTTALIIFLFICGALYLVGFWMTFGVDILGLVSLTEIPKSFILPFALSIGVLFIEQFIFALIFHDKNLGKTKGAAAINYIDTKSKKYLILNLDFLIIIIAISTFILNLFISKSPLFWLISVGALMVTVTIKVIFGSFVRRYIIGNNIFVFILATLITTPIISFILGKASALYIYNNKDIRYIKNITIQNNIQMFAQKDSLSFKSLGFLGDKFIISSLDNKEIIILNQASIQQIDFINKK